MAPTAMSQLPEKRLGIALLCLVLLVGAFLRVYPSAGTKYPGMDESYYRDAVISRRCQVFPAQSATAQPGIDHPLPAGQISHRLGDHTAARVEIDWALALSPNQPGLVALRGQLTGG